LAALTLPTIYGITCASELGVDTFLARARRALAAGLRLIQVREHDWHAGSRDALVRELHELAAPHGARLLLNGSTDDARRLRCAGVHWTAQRLNAATSRPRDLMVAASCHTHAEVMHASALDVDFVVLGPVLATPTHPDSTPLGWDGFAAEITGTRVPVFALGGLQRGDFAVAVAHGAHGLAMRRHAWPPER
jgi:8-oxo-dGTP diphosphatase